MFNLFQVIRNLTVYLFVILFIYSAISKLIDFENFQVQIAQSPLLTAFATPIAYGVVLGEILVALMLCFEKSKVLGLYLFLGFMSAFTLYIYLILNYSPFVPCSCGGVLENLGWRDHLWFNLFFCIAAILVILKGTNEQPKPTNNIQL